MKIAQSNPYLGKEEYKAIKECFDTEWLTEGPKAKEFVDKLCAIIGTKYGVLAPNGTLALYLGLRAAGVKPGDEVIVPDSTFIASATSVHMVGAIPVFVDIGADMQIDVEKLDRVLTARTKAIIPVHLWGMAANISSVMNFAKQHNLLVIEDAAQGMGVTWIKKHVGSFGNTGCFSFFADKSLTTIEGGFVATNDKETFEKLCYLRNQGRLHRGTFVHPEIGYNFRMNDMQCAIGLVQLQKADFIFKRRKEIHDTYCHHLAGVVEVNIIQPTEGSNHIPFRTVITTRDNQQDVSDFMKDKGIEIRTLFYPLHKQPCFSYLELSQDFNDDHFPNAIYAFEHGMCLPAYPQLTDKEIIYICNTIKEYYNV